MIATDIGYLLAVYQQPTLNLWEERQGFSFFARAVQLQAFSELASNGLGIPVPAGVAEAISWLQARLRRALEQQREHLRHLRRSRRRQQPAADIGL